MASGAELTPTSYVTHHLGHWTVGEGFWSLHLDTLFFSWLCGIAMLALFWMGAKGATAGVPHNTQQPALPFLADRLVPWLPVAAGYGPPVERPTRGDATVLSPSVTVDVLAAGYVPCLHPTATTATRPHG